MHSGLGKSVVVKGTLTAREDLVISGRIEGTVELPAHILTVLDGGEVHASVMAKSVLVLGKIVGDVAALERVELRAGSTISGDVKAPRLAMADGAFVNGTVDMGRRT